MIIERPSYMKRLIRQMGTDQVKVITGIRRCGKSFLLFNLFKSYLLGIGVSESNIFEMAFDRYGSRKYRDPEVFFPYVVDARDRCPLYRSAGGFVSDQPRETL